MEIGSLAKWVDELAGDLQLLRKRVDKIKLEPEPEPLTKYALIEQVGDVYQIVNPMQYHEDGTTTFVKDNSGEYLLLKTGAGTYVSYARSINPVDLTDLDAVNVTFTAGGETKSESADISTYTGEWMIGVYYESTANDNSVGVALFNGNTPQVLAVKIPVWTSSTGAGTVNVYGFVAEKTPEVTTKKTRKKK